MGVLSVYSTCVLRVPSSFLVSGTSGKASWWSFSSSLVNAMFSVVLCCVVDSL